jgi:hypothetical protein
MTISDDILSALIDGELEPAEAERVEILIARDPALAQRFERLRRADVHTQEAFEPFVSVPIELRAAAGAFDTWRRFAAVGAASLAACAAGLVLGLSLSRDDMGRLLALDSGVVASPNLTRGLDETASGGEARHGGVRVAPLYSFRDRDGRACRVFQASLRNSAIEAVACREGESWRLAALAPATPSAGRFSQAGGDDAQVIESAVDALGPTEITGVEERALIARGWAAK